MDALDRVSLHRTTGSPMWEVRLAGESIGTCSFGIGHAVPRLRRYDGWYAMGYGDGARLLGPFKELDLALRELVTPAPQTEDGT